PYLLPALGCALLVGVLAFHPFDRWLGRLLGPPSDGVLISLAEEEFQRAEVPYQRALADLTPATARAQRTWAPQRVAAHREGLAVLEELTARCQRAARARPADAQAQEQLYEAYRRQIAYLQDSLLAGPHLAHLSREDRR